MDYESPKNDQSSPLTPSSTTPGNGERPPSISIPDHTLLRCIGSGSYGEVWLARNMMGTFRAIKIVYRKSFRDPKPYQRELSGIQKYEPVSRSYDGFVDVLHVGINENEGYFYYIMELGDDEKSGQKIDPSSYAPKILGKEITAQQSLPFQECLQLGLALSQALAELHKHNLVHRDIKPSNIIFVNGVPKLADIGLVADLGEARSYVGTEGFIPPEGPGTPQADIYSLGKVLYEAGTGKDRQDFPALPTLVDEFPEHERLLELNEVILHACQNQPDKRYRTAWDMHADLLVLANGKSVKRLKQLERRVSSLKKMAGVASLILVALGVVGFEVYRERQSVLKSRRDVMLADLVQGNRALENGDPQGALAWYADAFTKDKDNKEASLLHSLRFNSCLARIPRLRQMWVLEDTISDARFLADSKAVIVSWEYGKVEAYDIETGKSKGLLFDMGTNWVSSAFSSDGQLLATTRGLGAVVEIWNTTKRAWISTLRHTNNVITVQFSLDGKHVATGCENGTVRIFEAYSGKLERTIDHYRKRVRLVQFNRDGRLLVTASEDKAALIWNTETGEQVGRPLRHKNWVKHGSFSPDDGWLVTSSFDRKAQVWEIANNGGDHRVFYELPHENGVERAEFSPDGQMLVTASLDGFVRLWCVDSLRSPSPYLILRHGHVARVTHVMFSPDSRCLMTICADGGVQIWDLAGIIVPPVPLEGFINHSGSVAVSVSGNGSTLRETLSSNVIAEIKDLTAGYSGVEFSHNDKFLMVRLKSSAAKSDAAETLNFWDLTTRKLSSTFGLMNGATNVVLSDDGRRLATFVGTNVDVWEIQTGKKLISLPQAHGVVEVIFNRSGSRLVVCGGNLVQVFDSSTGREISPALTHLYRVNHAEFNSDESLLVTCCSGRDYTASYAQVWDVATGQPVGRHLDHSDGVLFATFSPDGSMVATAGEDFNAILWNFRTANALIPALRHSDQIRKIRFSPDGKWLVTASSDKSARVWDARTGNPLTPPLRHLTPLEDARFLNDGFHIVTTDAFGTSSVWELLIGERFMDDAVSLARLLSADAMGASHEVLSRNVSASLWQQLRSKYPNLFTVSETEIQRWHKNKIAESESNKNWSAVAFHLNQLLALHPTDQSLLDRLARVRENLEVGQAKPVRSP
jgi:WD40 repeat protein/serine/threonine protein kinase